MGTFRIWPCEAALVKGESVCSTRTNPWRQLQRRPELRIMAPGSRPARRRIAQPGRHAKERTIFATCRGVRELHPELQFADFTAAVKTSSIKPAGQPAGV